MHWQVLTPEIVRREGITHAEDSWEFERHHDCRAEAQRLNVPLSPDAYRTDTSGLGGVKTWVPMPLVRDPEFMYHFTAASPTGDPHWYRRPTMAPTR